MALPTFLIFIGTLLGCTIALAVVVKNLAEGFAVGGKRPLLYGSVSAILASLAAYLASLISINPFEVFWYLGGIFLLLGILHILFVHNRYYYAHKHNSTKVLIVEIVFGLSLILFAIAVFSVLQYFVRKDKDFLFYPVVVSTLLFFVPLLVFHSFQAAYAIPEAIFPTWQYPLHKPIVFPEIHRNSRTLVIGFEVAKKATDSRKTYFRVKASETWTLGDLFYHFINEHNDPPNENTIECANNDDEPYEWWFYQKQKWYRLQKILNPEYTIRENGIQENTVIICERSLSIPIISNTYNKNYHA
jgi:hypothetical protein